MSATKTFISYSHDSDEHIDRVLALANRLRAEGVDCILDQYEPHPPKGWPLWMEEQIDDMDFVLMICTEIYCRRVKGEEKPGKGRGVKWEGGLIRNHIYDADAENQRFIPVLLSPEDEAHLPTYLKGYTRYFLDGDDGYEDLYRRLTNQPKVEKPGLGKLKKLPPKERRQDFRPPKLHLAKLPITDHEIFGRENELAMLDQAWAEPHVNVFSLVAWGGVGKSALVNAWLNEMERDNYRGAQRVYGWSFYSQGTKEERQVSADEFLNDALKWFGYTGDPILSPWDKGKKLAELVRAKRSLLILDGLEPLQYPPGEMQGRLKDQGMQALLKDLARSNPGLCVISTRLKIEDLEPTEGRGSQRLDLDNLTPEAGAQLLAKLGVQGTEKERRDAAKEFEGHALALNLLGSYLKTVHGGEIRKRDLIPKLSKDRKQGGHARRVMQSYEKWLKDTPELNILYLMGLFDRPAAKGALDALRKEPAIHGLTDKLQNLGHDERQFAVQSLRDLRLLAAEEQDKPDTLDCHPLMREHFGERLQQQFPEAWTEAHSRLYNYYKNLPEKELPDTLEEMEPLFAAVTHGCLAGKHQEALDDVFYERIYRKNEKYSVHKLGAFGADLAALSNFFDPPWRRPAAGLTDADKAVVLSWAGFGLRALGRLREAAAPMQAGLEMQIEQENWKQAAIGAGNLSELFLTLGEVRPATDYARQSVDFADRSGDAFQRESKRTTHADALHQSGALDEAEKLYREAEAMQQERQPDYRYLYSLQGFRYCELLLSRGKAREVLGRVEAIFEWRKLPKWNPVFDSILDIANDNLSLYQFP